MKKSCLKEFCIFSVKKVIKKLFHEYLPEYPTFYTGY